MKWRMKIQMELISAVVIDRNNVYYVRALVVLGVVKRSWDGAAVWMWTGRLGETRECDLDRLSRVLPLDFVGSGSPTSRRMTQSCR